MQPRSEEILTAGVDLGASKVALALVGDNGRVLNVRQFPTDNRKGPEDIIHDIILHIKRDLGAEIRHINGLGIGIAGQVDFKGFVHCAPNLRWQNIPLKQILEDKLGIPVVVVNDVRASTWGEWQFGSGKTVNDLAVLFVGTGIGGGIISGGHMVSGCSNTGGEFGHITIVAGGRKCTCSNRGCLEAYASGHAIAERARDAVRSDPRDGEELISRAGNPENITAKIIQEAFRDGDPFAVRFMHETAQFLAAGMVSIVNAFNPCMFILGGGVIEGFPELIGLVEPVVRKNALGAAVKDLKIEKASLGVNAGIIGAADLARRVV